MVHLTASVFAEIPASVLAMAPKAAKKAPVAKALLPVQLKACISVVGGYLHKPVLVDCTTATHLGVEVKFVGVSHQDTWFCEMVTGKAYSLRPLSKSNALAGMRSKLTQELLSLPAGPGVAGPAVDDEMADAAYSDEEPEINPSPTKKQKALASVLAGKEGTVVELSMLANPGASPEVPRRKVRFLSQKGAKMWVEVDGLSWLSHFVREERSCPSLQECRSTLACSRRMPRQRSPGTSTTSLGCSAASTRLARR